MERDLKFIWKTLRQDWKLYLHLLLGTKRFGVNNKWWERFDDVTFGTSFWSIVWRVIRIQPLFNSHKMIKYRAVYLHFLDDESCRKLGWLIWKRKNDIRVTKMIEEYRESCSKNK